MKKIVYGFCGVILLLAFFFSHYSNGQSEKNIKIAFQDVDSHPEYVLKNYSGSVSDAQIIVYSSLSCQHCRFDFLHNFKNNKTIYRFVYSNFFDVSATLLFLNLPNAEKKEFVNFVYLHQSEIVSDFADFLVKNDSHCWHDKIASCEMLLNKTSAFNFWSKHLSFKIEPSFFKDIDKSLVDELLKPQSILFNEMGLRGTPFFVYKS